MDELKEQERAWALFQKHNSSSEVAKEMGCPVSDVFRLIQPALNRMRREVNEMAAELTKDNRHLPNCINQGCNGKLHPPTAGQQHFVCDQCQTHFRLNITQNTTPDPLQ